MAEKPKVADYEQPAYTSKYQNQIDSAMNTVTNREKFAYDPLKDANYQALAKVYSKQGEQAAQNTMADAASLNGGYGSSYGITAAQQARNDYNQQLASQIPALQEAAYNRYVNDYDMNLSALDALRAADESDYGKHRDDVADSQWKYGVNYQGYRDDVADSQWQKNYDRDVFESDRSYNYQKSRDAVADKQWAQEFALQKKSAAGSSRSGSSGRRSSSSGYIGSRSGSGGSSGGNLQSLWDKAQEKSSSKGSKKSSKTSKKSTKSKKTYTDGVYGQFIKNSLAKKKKK